MNLSTREIQLSCLKVLVEFDGLCRARGLRYFLSGGTLLGAIRHRGFIPWDDDVDVMMPRADYERLLAMGDGRIFSLNSGDYGRPWARMADESTRRSSEALFSGDTDGAYIDIFPIDGVPADARRERRFYRRIRICDMLWRTATRNSIGANERLRTIKKIAAALLRPIGAKPFARRMNRIAMAQNYDGEFRGVSMITHYGARERMPAGVFDRAVEVEFEGLHLPAPCGWDEYLSRLYGDYMTLPPQHQRATHHSSYTKVEENNKSEAEASE